MHRLSRAVPLVLFVLSLATLLSSRGVTLPLYAARTGLMCQNCHFDPNGGGPRNEFGFAFARNRHALEPEDSTSEWHDLAVVNRIGDAMPVYLGLNQRFMLLASTSAQDNSLDEFGFYNMESALHIAFQPHRRLLMVYTRDGFDAGSSTKEAYGLISGFPLDGYLRAGRFRTPFGLRWDDHTVATRNSYLDLFATRVSFLNPPGEVRLNFLPYDPRQPDMGIEAGGDRGPWFGRAAFTNGGSYPLGPTPNRAQAIALKLGINLPQIQTAASLYDDYHLGLDAFSFSEVSSRLTRWGYYALSHAGPMAFLGEIAAGTDRYGSRDINSLAYILEADYRVTRGVNVRARFDRMELYRDPSLAAPSSTVTLSGLNTHNRYSLEGEFDPVPFAELRWALRYIDHAADQFPDGSSIDDERQAFLQFHFSY